MNAFRQIADGMRLQNPEIFFPAIPTPTEERIDYSRVGGGLNLPPDPEALSYIPHA